MLGLALDLASHTLRTGTWLIGKTYNGVSYLIYDSDKDQVISKIEELENKLNHLHDVNDSNNQRFYWKNKHIYNNYDWIVICNETLLCRTTNKSEALISIASHAEEDPNHKCLLVQVGNEITMFEI